MKRKFRFGDRWITREGCVVTVTDTSKLKSHIDDYPVEVTDRYGIPYYITVDGKEYDGLDSDRDLVERITWWKDMFKTLTGNRK